MLKISAEEYHKIDAIGSSSLVKAIKSLAHYKAHIDGLSKITSTQQKNFDLGNVLHSCVLEQSIDSVAKAPCSDARTKKWKNFVSANPDKIVLKPFDFDGLSRAFNAAVNHPVFEPIINTALVEKSFVTEYKGLNLKARPDLLFLEDGCLIDYKSTVDASTRAFSRAIVNYHYHIRLAHYAFVIEKDTGKPINRFIFVAQEKEVPEAIGFFELNKPDIDRAKANHRTLLNKVIVATKDDFWPAYSEEIQMIDLPEWAFLQEETF